MGAAEIEGRLVLEYPWPFCFVIARVLLCPLVSLSVHVDGGGFGDSLLNHAVYFDSTFLVLSSLAYCQYAS